MYGYSERVFTLSCVFPNGSSVACLSFYPPLRRRQVFCVLLWMLDEYWYYSLFTLFMLVTFESTVVGQRLRNLKELRSLQTPKQPILVYRCGRGACGLAVWVWLRVCRQVWNLKRIAAQAAYHDAPVDGLEALHSSGGRKSTAVQRWVVRCLGA